MGAGDWNDGMNRVGREGRGESVWLGWFLHAVLRQFIPLCEGRDPARADYPMGYGNTKPNGSWFRLGFPSGYVTDVLQVLEALCEAGAAGDPRLGPAIEWLLAQRDDRGRWANRYAYVGKMIVDIDVPGRPSKWVTLRACRVLRAVAVARGQSPSTAPS